MSLSTLSGWAARCFSTLPEYFGDTGRSRVLPPCAIAFSEVAALFERFDEVATSRLRDSERWLDGSVPPAATYSMTDTVVADLNSPFVRRVELPEGHRIVMIGDLHGSIHSLTRSLLRLHEMGVVADDWTVRNPAQPRLLACACGFGGFTCLL